MTKYKCVDSCNLENWSRRRLNSPAFLSQLTLFTFCISLTLESDPAQFHVLASTFSPYSTNAVPRLCMAQAASHLA